MQLFNVSPIFYTIELKSFKCVKHGPSRNYKPIIKFVLLGLRVVTTFFITRMKKNITLFLALRQRLKGKCWVTKIQIDALKGNTLLHNTFYTTAYSTLSTFWGMDHAKEKNKLQNYKSSRDFPILTDGKS